MRNGSMIVVMGMSRTYHDGSNMQLSILSVLLQFQSPSMRKVIALFLLLIFTSSQLLAWGPKGHQIVGDIARAHLTEIARRNIQQLLGNDDLASIANWADEVRPKRPESNGWPFVDTHKADNGFYP